MAHFPFFISDFIRSVIKYSAQEVYPRLLVLGFKIPHNLALPSSSRVPPTPKCSASEWIAKDAFLVTWISDVRSQCGPSGGSAAAGDGILLISAEGRGSPWRARWSSTGSLTVAHVDSLFPGLRPPSSGPEYPGLVSPRCCAPYTLPYHPGQPFCAFPQQFGITTIKHWEVLQGVCIKSWWA